MTQELSSAEKNKLAERIAKAVGKTPFRAGHFGLERTPLPFYKNAYDVHIKCFTTRPMITKEYVFCPTCFFRIESDEDDSEPIGSIS